jgi:Zn-dependent M28 family amino/carboxypeptidase
VKIVGYILLITLACTALLVGCVAQPFVSQIAPTNVPSVDAAQLRRDVEHLSIALASRHSGDHQTLTQTAEFLQASFSAMHAATSLQSYEVDGKTYSNVIARFGPSFDAKTGAPIVIGAHYDAHADTAGADDNASGVAGLLALGRLLNEHPPSVPVELVAYTLEEPPFFRSQNMGSRRHAAGLVSAGIKPKLIMVLEMIGYFDDRAGSQNFPFAPMKLIYPDRGNFIAVVANFASSQQTRLVKAAMTAASPLPVESINAPAGMTGIDFSDHASYWLHDMPAVMITDTSFYRNANYHQATDTADTLDYTRMAQVVQAVYGVVTHLESTH